NAALIHNLGLAQPGDENRLAPLYGDAHDLSASLISAHFVASFSWSVSRASAPTLALLRMPFSASHRLSPSVASVSASRQLSANAMYSASFLGAVMLLGSVTLAAPLPSLGGLAPGAARPCAAVAPAESVAVGCAEACELPAELAVGLACSTVPAPASVASPLD